MRLLQQVVTKHEDLIQDLAYNYYGKRLATCSSDQRIKVWDFDDSQGWICTADWKSHNGSILKIDWAAPEFGQIIASCSVDRSVCIWEEPEDNETSELKKWEKRASFGDSHGTIFSVKFAPAHLGLKLAGASEDGLIRIYEATDITNLSNWSLTDQIDTGEGPNGGVTTISWNNSPFDPPNFVVGSNDSTAKVWQYNNKNRKWEIVCSLLGHEGGIHDVSWAPNMGHNYHLIATASKDRFARIWKLEVNNKGKWIVNEIPPLPHDSQVWKVDWNITGTILASSADDGTVRMWKMNYRGEWALLNVIAKGFNEI